MRKLLPLLFMLFILFGCGPEADRIGVGAECSGDDDCHEELECLTEFSGGYCGFEGCESHADCPEYSSCVDYDSDNNYCFRDCESKAECNANRDADNEANCASNVDFTEDTGGLRACVPPSG